VIVGFLDRMLGTQRQTPPNLPPEEPNFELTVTVGDEVSTFSIPLDLSDEEFSFAGPRCTGPQQTADQCWVLSDKAVEVAGRRIGGGLFYLGENLPTGDRQFPVPEPALIDPTLDVASESSGEGPSRVYWPSYERLSPADRAAYLEWLSGPRHARDVSQSLAFLYFYGLERRLLADPEESALAASERTAIVEEVVRLHGEAGDDQERGALAHHLGHLLEFLAAQDLLHGRSNPPPPVERTGWQVPLTLRLMLGEVAAAGLPLPAELAVSWALTSPEAYLRTPAQRCRAEFSSLFELRYRERFDRGLALPRGKNLQVAYRASSPGLREIEEPTSLPDIADAPKLIEPMRVLARDCCAELDPYSRLLGRNPAEAETLKGVALLPGPLLKRHTHEALEHLIGLLDRTSSGELPWVLGASDLLAHWPGSQAKLRKKEAVSLAQLVEKLGFGIEPDVRFGGNPPAQDDTIVVFAASELDPRAPSPTYATATMLLDLVAAVAAADGTVTAEEERHLEAHIASAIDLYPGERERLRAHVEQMTRSKPSFAGLRKKLEPLTPEQKDEIGSGLVAVAAADGHISPEEVKVLGKVFGLLGLDPDSVYSKAHAAAAGAGVPTGISVGIGVDSDRSDDGAAADGETLDRSAIERKIEETALVSSMLAGIFDGGDDAGAEAVAPTGAETGPLRGLTGAHAALVRDLAEQASWSRAEVEALAAQYELLVDGALEVINNAAFEHWDAPFSEGDDPVEIDEQVAKEMLI
jgi:uncharacterized tellurite resistance protein B-like protein